MLGHTDFTSQATGTAADALDAPTGVALDATGNLFVADYENHRVLVFAR